ncbi:MAG: CBS domain-containing protein [Candidatus Saccharimonadales bacterium]
MHMLSLFAITILVALSMLAASLRSVYGFVSAHELKRRSQKGDQVAATLYQVVRHGLTADLFLLSVSIIACALAAIFISELFPSVFAVLLIAILLGLVFIVLPKRTSKSTRKLALRVSPYLARILRKIRPTSNKIASFVRLRQPVAVHTGLYEKDDLLELLQRQKKVIQNRIEESELDLAIHVLTFSDKKVSDCMVPKHAVHFVSSEEPVGPILMSELFDSGFSRFPVNNHEGTVVGTLFLKDLVDKRTTGIVSNVMSPTVSYVSHDAPLEEVLIAFVATKQLMFMVTDATGEVVGIVTIEDVLEQMIGRQITA